KQKSAFAAVNDGADPMKAVFHGMHDLAVLPDSKLLLADSFNNRVRLLDLPARKVSTFAGTGEAKFGGDGGPAAAASFNVAMCATLSPDKKRFYIADIGNHRARVVDLSTGRVDTVAGNGKKGNPVDGTNALEAPMGDARATVMARDGTLYVLLRG